MQEGSPNQIDVSPGCGFFFGWLLGTVLGAGLGWAVGWWLSFRVPGPFSTITLGAVMGFFVGAFQWLLLRESLPRAGWWVLASAAGWAAGFPLGVLIAQNFGQVEAVFGLIVGAMAGAAAGIVQWLLLRRTFSNTVWWIPVSVFAWSSSLLYYRPGVSAIGLFYGILAGLVTGTAMLWFVFRPTS